MLTGVVVGFFPRPYIDVVKGEEALASLVYYVLLFICC